MNRQSSILAFFFESHLDAPRRAWLRNIPENSLAHLAELVAGLRGDLGAGISRPVMAFVAARG